MKTASEFSAGGVVFRHAPRATLHAPTNLWLVCKHSGYHKWVLPKGIVEEGESPEQAAIREVAEETGIKARIIKKITPDVRYTYSKNGILVNKRVAFYLMEYESGDVADRSWEMEDARWAAAADAAKLLAFPTERHAFNAAVAVQSEHDSE